MEMIESIRVTTKHELADCQFCISGHATWKCIECEADNEDCLLCDDCIEEHIEAQDGIMPLSKARKAIIPLLE